MLCFLRWRRMNFSSKSIFTLGLHSWQHRPKGEKLKKSRMKKGCHAQQNYLGNQIHLKLPLLMKESLRLR
jgi:hypothetical protein